MEDQTNEEMQAATEPQENTLSEPQQDDTAAEPQSPKEEIKFQRIMDYKAYRTGMILFRLAVTLALATALAFAGIFSVFFGIILPVIALIIGAIAILVSLGNEQTYNVYNTRVVIKRRGDDKRKSVPLQNIVSVRFKSAFYEKRRCIGTVTICAKNDSGAVKKYKLKHIFDAKPVIEYLNGFISGGNADGSQDRK